MAHAVGGVVAVMAVAAVVEIVVVTVGEVVDAAVAHPGHAGASPGLKVVGVVLDGDETVVAVVVVVVGDVVFVVGVVILVEVGQLQLSLVAVEGKGKTVWYEQLNGRGRGRRFGMNS